VDDSATVYTKSSASHSPRHRTARPSNDQYSLSRVPETRESREGSEDTLAEYRQERSASGRAWEEQARSERRRRVNERERLVGSDWGIQHHRQREADQPRSLKADMLNHNPRSPTVAATLPEGDYHGREQFMYDRFHERRSGREEHMFFHTPQATFVGGHEHVWAFDPHRGSTRGQCQQPLHCAPQQPVANSYHDLASSRLAYRQHLTSLAPAPSQATIIASQYLDHLHETYAFPGSSPTRRGNPFDPQHPMWNGRFDHVQPAHQNGSMSGYFTTPERQRTPVFDDGQTVARSNELPRPSSSAQHPRMMYPAQELRHPQHPQYTGNAARREGMERWCWDPRDGNWYAYGVDDDWIDPR